MLPGRFVYLRCLPTRVPYGPFIICTEFFFSLKPLRRNRNSAPKLFRAPAMLTVMLILKTNLLTKGTVHVGAP